MKFVILAEDSLGERSAMVVTAENMPSALFTKEKPDTAIKEEAQVKFTMGTVVRIGAEF